MPGWCCRRAHSIVQQPTPISAIPESGYRNFALFTSKALFTPDVDYSENVDIIIVWGQILRKLRRVMVLRRVADFLLNCIKDYVPIELWSAYCALNPGFGRRIHREVQHCHSWPNTTTLSERHTDRKWISTIRAQ